MSAPWTGDLPKVPRKRDTRDRSGRVRKDTRPVLTLTGHGEVRGAGWGAIATGRWVGGGAVPDVHGVCQLCMRVAPARDLITVDLPFGRGEITKHRGGC